VVGPIEAAAPMVQLRTDVIGDAKAERRQHVLPPPWFQYQIIVPPPVHAEAHRLITRAARRIRRATQDQPMAETIEHRAYMVTNA
jgi:hypothetical protein